MNKKILLIEENATKIQKFFKNPNQILLHIGNYPNQI